MRRIPEAACWVGKILKTADQERQAVARTIAINSHIPKSLAIRAALVIKAPITDSKLSQLPSYCR
jgi:hypothetical protein